MATTEERVATLETRVAIIENFVKLPPVVPPIVQPPPVIPVPPPPPDVPMPPPLVPTISVGGARVEEGGNLVFTLTMSQPTTAIVEIAYDLQGRGATPGIDYANIPGGWTWLKFMPGETVKTITVPTIEDVAKEAEEILFLNLWQVKNAKLNNTWIQGVIVDDDVSAPIPPPPPPVTPVPVPAPGSADEQAFALSVRMRESNNTYDAVNRWGSGATGAYQFHEIALADATPRGDYYSKPSRIYNNDWSGVWGRRAQAHGVRSIEDFKRSPAFQDEAFWAWMTTNSEYAKPWWGPYLGKFVKGVKVTPCAILGACHLVGHGAARDYVLSNGTKNPADPGGTTTEAYFARFSPFVSRWG
jgi:hypothetical protein